MVKLVKPKFELKNKFMDMIKVYSDYEEDTFTNEYFTGDFDFLTYIKDLEDLSMGIGLPEGYVPITELWLVNDNNDILGTVILRHYLGEEDMEEGGHIGYDISPKYRKMGYGTKILELILPIAKTYNIDTVLLTCSDDNIGSQKIIEKNGGILKNTIISKDTGEKLLQYSIEL